MYGTLKYWLKDQFLLQKLNNPLGFALFLSLGLVIAFLISKIGLVYGAVLYLLIIILPLVGACLFNQFIGVCLVVTIAFLIDVAAKHVNAPFGISLDALIFLLLFGIVIKQTLERNWDFAKNGISYCVIIWIYYNMIQGFNPWAESKMAWLYTVRSMAVLTLLFYVASYAIKDLQRAKFIIKYIIGLSLFAALYGMKQEFIGFSNAETAWLYADSHRFQLIVQWDRMRIFSLFSDPTTFGILMSYMSVFCLIIAAGPFKVWQRLACVIAAICMLMGMAFAGSRTPFVLVPLGFIIYTLLTLKKEVLIIAGVGFVLFTGAMMKSTSNPVIFRIQSAFKPTADASVQVRLDNQALIQPFIQEHPFGVGLGSTGMWAQRFTPDSWLAGFAHDSGFVRVAVELGYIGALIYAFYLFIVIRTCIFYYLRVRNPQIKTFYLAILVSLFMLIVASYPQEAITLLPTSIIFYIFLALIVRLKDFDDDYDTVYADAVKESQKPPLYLQ